MVFPNTLLLLKNWNTHHTTAFSFKVSKQHGVDFLQVETKEKEKEGDETKRNAQPDRARFAHGHSGVVQLDTDHVVDAKADSSKAFFCTKFSAADVT